MLCPFRRGLAIGSRLGLSAGSTVWCSARGGRQRHIFINILSPQAGQSRATAQVLRGRVATEGKPWCPTGEAGEQRERVAMGGPLNAACGRSWGPHASQEQQQG